MKGMSQEEITKAHSIGTDLAVSPNRLGQRLPHGPSVFFFFSLQSFILRLRHRAEIRIIIIFPQHIFLNIYTINKTQSTFDK